MQSSPILPGAMMQDLNRLEDNFLDEINVDRCDVIHRFFKFERNSAFFRFAFTKRAVIEPGTIAFAVVHRNEHANQEVSGHKHRKSKHFAENFESNAKRSQCQRFRQLQTFRFWYNRFTRFTIT